METHASSRVLPVVVVMLGHAVQVSGCVLMVWSAMYMPALHGVIDCGVQLPPVYPCMLWYVSSGHALHSCAAVLLPISANKAPISQECTVLLEQAVTPDVAAEYCPDGHSAHVYPPVAPMHVPDRYMPAPHTAFEHAMVQ